MLTIFTVPKPFQGHINVIQRNAIKSWTLLEPKPEIILFGNEKGTAELADEFGLKHIPEVEKNEFGTPLANDIFTKAQEITQYQKMAYLNADIILMSDFMRVVQYIKKPLFLVVGRRWDLDLKEPIQFNETDWESKIHGEIIRRAKLHGFSGIDYFIFPRGIWKNIPPFALGRTAWDNWFLYKAFSLGIPLIDASQVIVALHQNHSYSHHPKGKAGIWKGLEAQKNLKIAGGFSHTFTIRDANWILTPAGLKKPKLTIYRLFSFPFRYYEKLPALKVLLFPGWLGMILWRKVKHYFF